jgi:ribosomal protein L31E
MCKNFASKDIQKELGESVTDNNYTWVIAELNGFVIGFCALEEAKLNVHLRHAYVIKGFRGYGVFTNLNNKRMEVAKKLKKDIVVVATDLSKNIHKKNRFEPIKEYKNYTKLKLNKEKFDVNKTDS